MSLKLNDTQLILLSAAWRREDHYLTPPGGARMAPARKAAAKLLTEGLVRELRARADAPIWRRDEETERAFALKLTAAGIKAIAAREEEGEGRAATPMESATEQSAEKAKGGARLAEAGETKVDQGVRPKSRAAPRSGTKIEDVVKMLGRSEGATIDAIIAATGWLPHSTRAALTGLRKRGYGIDRARGEDGGFSVYRLTPLAQGMA